MIGQLEIKKAGKYAKDKLGDEFSLKDFHYQVNNFDERTYLSCLHGQREGMKMRAHFFSIL